MGGLTVNFSTLPIYWDLGGRERMEVKINVCYR